MPDPPPQSDMEDNLTKDATLESELWTMDEINWPETRVHTPTIKYVPVQVRPLVAKLRERVPKLPLRNAAPTRCVLGSFSSPLTRCFHTSSSDAKRTNNTALAADVKKHWTKLFPEPKTQPLDPLLNRTDKTSHANSCSPSNFSPRAVPRDLARGRYEHWQWMTKDDGDLEGFVWAAFWKLATARVPTEILGTFLAARIVPGSKPNGGVRSFAIGQVVRRLFCKAAANLLTKKVRSLTSPHQYAVGMKQGPELLQHIVSAHIAIHRGLCRGQRRRKERPRLCRMGRHPE